MTASWTSVDSFVVGEAGSHLGELALLRHPVELSWVASFSEPVLVETGVVKIGALVESFLESVPALGRVDPGGAFEGGNCAAIHDNIVLRSE